MSLVPVPSYPYSLHVDDAVFAGSGSSSTNAIVKRVTIPAGTLAVNGGRVVIVAQASTTIGSNMAPDAWRIFLEANGGEVFSSVGGKATELMQVTITRTGPASATIQENFDRCVIGDSIDWAAEQTLEFHVAENAQLEWVHVQVFPH